jgi:hypothetical protein
MLLLFENSSHLNANFFLPSSQTYSGLPGKLKIRASFDASMADTDKETTVSLEPAKEATEHAALLTENVVTIATDDTSEGVLNETKGPDSQASQPVGDLTGSSTSAATLGSSASSSVNVPHPKRFSAVNINKKFLEKNSSATGAIQTSSTSTVAKAGGPVCKSLKLPP